MSEIWKDIPGYEGLYQASNWGNIKSLGNLTHPNEHMLKQHYCQGYKIIKLCSNGIIRPFPVHVIIAKSFPEICGEWFDGCQVDHLDTVKDNNVPENLKVCTIKENNNNPLTRKHKSESKTGNKNPNYGKRLDWALKALSDKISKPLSAYKYPTKEYVGTWKNSLEASKALGIPCQNINDACNCKGNRFTCRGLMFVFNSMDNHEEILDKRIKTLQALKNGKPVLQLSLDNKIIKRWDSTQEAVRCLGLRNCSGIYASCSGKRKTAGGFIWRYAERVKKIKNILQ